MSGLCKVSVYEFLLASSHWSPFAKSDDDDNVLMSHPTVGVLGSYPQGALLDFRRHRPCHFCFENVHIQWWWPHGLQ